MKKLIFYTFLAIQTIFQFRQLPAQNLEPFCEKTNEILQLLIEKHYQPVQLNDTWKNVVLKNTFNNLDTKNQFFTAKEIDSLTTHCGPLDSLLKTGFCPFILGVISVYQKKLQNSEAAIESITANPLDFKAKDSITFVTYDSSYYSKDNAEWWKRWVKYIKFQTLRELYTQNEISGKTITPAQFQQNEKVAREKVKTKLIRKIHSLESPSAGIPSEVASALYNAIASSFDPHSEYFSGDDANSFYQSLSSSELSFGLDLQITSDDDLIISRLIPGGPAWKTNELHAGDKILEFQWPDGTTVDLASVDPDDAANSLLSNPNKKVNLKVQKQNGQVVTISLIKEKLSNDENTIKSYVLKGDKTIGFISLPDFYSSQDENSRSGCANDMAKEILKLKKENIDGLILDLRNNGGGYIDEALSLIGIFIDYGPAFVLRTKDNVLYPLKDTNRGTVYDGPLIVLVNGYSASASEITAGALQDYRRAIIVGSTTFGKATSQGIFPLSESTPPGKNLKNMPEEFIKITIDKIYRLNLHSYQLTGIIPDIKLPQLANFNDREASLPFALPNDFVDNKLYFKPYPPLPIEKLREESAERVAADEKFKEIDSLNNKLKSASKNSLTFLLTPDKFSKQYKSYLNFWDIPDSMFSRPAKDFKVLNNKFDDQVMSMDTFKKDANNQMLKTIENDIYIEETYSIMNDFINLSKN